MSSSVLRFRMSGRAFAFDGARDLSALEVTELRQVGVTIEELVALFSSLGEGEDLLISTDVKLRGLCALAYIAALREDPATEWRTFAASIHPGTFEAVTEPVKVDDQVAAAAQQAAQPVDPHPLFTATQHRQTPPV